MFTLRRFCVSFLFLAWVSAASAHYGMVIPSDSMVLSGESKTLSLALSFSHPFEQVGMTLVKPRSFQVTANGTSKELLESLSTTQILENPAWTTEYRLRRPGAYHFVMEPHPYWEPTEDKFIIHYTKTTIAAFGDDAGWDVELGLKTEIIPLSKPFGLYTGNVFQGMVKLDGKVIPFAEVEVEYYNQKNPAEAPNELMITQTIKADPNGVFTYAAPQAGWWGFAALSEADYQLKHQGQSKAVELGAVIWVEFHDWKHK